MLSMRVKWNSTFFFLLHWYLATGSNELNLTQITVRLWSKWHNFKSVSLPIVLLTTIGNDATSRGYHNERHHSGCLKLEPAIRSLIHFGTDFSVSYLLNNCTREDIIEEIYWNMAKNNFARKCDKYCILLFYVLLLPNPKTNHPHLYFKYCTKTCRNIERNKHTNKNVELGCFFRFFFLE